MAPDETDRKPAGHDGLRGARRFSGAIGNFWQRVTEGLEIQVLWSQFASEARASYSLYTREVGRMEYLPDAGFRLGDRVLPRDGVRTD